MSYMTLFPSIDPSDAEGDREDVINKVAERLKISPEEVRQKIVDAESKA